MRKYKGNWVLDGNKNGVMGIRTEWRLVMLNDFLDIDLMLVSAFGVDIRGFVLLLVYS